MGKLNESIGNTILEKAPKNAKYTSPDIQKDVLNVIAHQVRTKIRQEIGDAKFCILVDEARDASNKEQMAIVLRFVDIDGVLRERFFAIVNVADTTATTLKKEISDVLGRYDLHIHNMRGQGYDGASNMRGSWNGLQALFLKECSCAYYVHCFAHRLQLALIAAAEKEPEAYIVESAIGSGTAGSSSDSKFKDILRNVWAEHVDGSSMFRVSKNLRLLNDQLHIFDKRKFSNISERVMASRIKLEDDQGRLLGGNSVVHLNKEKKAALEKFRNLSSLE
ncbi:zinc finger MYM-type protein 1-like [Impatiens glandulifera]|uniref:zinc finger MYM-type protein 1-like n=1 Tax=Impatiens glandulifera TaxID=253017 RepID=UPI001FB11A8A|nr:zinc finger MYM-type protein 1-like [Impatiens glandulifera]